MSAASILAVASEFISLVSELTKPGPAASESDAILGKIRDAVRTVDDHAVGRLSGQTALERLKSYRDYRSETRSLEETAINKKFPKKGPTE